MFEEGHMLHIDALDDHSSEVLPVALLLDQASNMLIIQTQVRRITRLERWRDKNSYLSHCGNADTCISFIIPVDVDNSERKRGKIASKSDILSENDDKCVFCVFRLTMNTVCALSIPNKHRTLFF